MNKHQIFPNCPSKENLKIHMTSLANKQSIARRETFKPDEDLLSILSRDMADDPFINSATFNIKAQSIHSFISIHRSTFYSLSTIDKKIRLLSPNNVYGGAPRKDIKYPSVDEIGAWLKERYSADFIRKHYLPVKK